MHSGFRIKKSNIVEMLYIRGNVPGSEDINLPSILANIAVVENDDIA
jgi:hypothetical protein